MECKYANKVTDDSCYDVNQLIEAAEVQAAACKYSEAFNFLMKAHEKDNSNLWVFTKLAHCYLLLGNYQMSYGCYCKLLQVGSGPVLEEAWFGLGELYFKQRRFSEAEAAYKAVLSLNSSFEMISTIFLKLAIICKIKENALGAIAYLKASCKCRDLTPIQLNEVLINLGSCFETIGGYKLALSLYLEAAKLRETAKNLACLAWIYIKCEKHKKSKRVLLRAMQLAEPSSKEFHDLQFLLSLSHVKSHNILESVRILKNLLVHYPNEPYYLAAYAIVEDKQGNYHSALQYLWQASTLLTTRSDFLYMLGQVYEKLHLYTESMFLYSRISEMFPSNLKARTRLLEYQSCRKPRPETLADLSVDITEFPFNKHIFQRSTMTFAEPGLEPPANSRYSQLDIFRLPGNEKESNIDSH